MPLSRDYALGRNLPLAAGQCATPIIEARGFFVPGLPIFSSKVQGLLEGLNDVIIVSVADSITMGAISNPTAQLQRPNGWPVRLALLASAAGYPMQMDNAYGTGQEAAGVINVNDNRVLFTTGASSTLVTGNYGPGGRAWVLSSGTGSVSFVCPNICDTIAIRYGKSPGFGGTFNVNVDGGSSLGLLSEVGASDSYEIATFNVSRSTHTINCIRASGISVIFGIEAWDSTVKSVRFKNIAIASSTTGDWNTISAPWNPKAAFAAEAAHLVSIALGPNDWIGGVSLATFEANLRDIISTARVTSDVILQTPFPSQATAVSAATQLTYVDVIRSLSSELVIPLVDVFAHFVSWEAANAAGKTGDPYHPNSAGMDDIAALWQTALSLV